jgi:hypothetical protein
MANHAIRAEIDRRIEECSYAAGLNRAAMLKRLHDLTLVDRTKFFDLRGGILPPGEWPKEAFDIVISYNPGSGTAARKIRFNSVADILFKLLKEIRLLGRRKGDPVQVAVNINQTVHWEAEKNRLLARGESIDVTPTLGGLMRQGPRRM